MRGRNRFSVSVQELTDNQFLQNEPSHFRASKVQAYSKDMRVKKLEERNVKLQEEVIRIERALSQAEEKSHYGIRLPQIKGDVVRKELENAYKLVKQYEYEINKRKRLNSQQSFVQQLRKSERIMKEKQELSDKLRKQILQIKKKSVELVRLLKNDNLKKQYQEKQVKFSADIKWFHEKLRKAEAKSAIQNNNLEKQLKEIKKLQQQLTDNHHYEKNILQSLRSKIFNGQRTVNLSKLDEQESDEQLDVPESRNESLLPTRTPYQAYQMMLAEVKLLRKLEKDYESKLETLGRQKQEAEDHNFKSRNRLIEIQYELQNVEGMIADLKKQVNPKALIPTKIDMLIEQKRRHSSSVIINKVKITIPHAYKYSEIGQATKAGKRFIDRTAIGKRPAKIIGVTFYEKKDGQKELMGFQAVYMAGTIKKKGNLNVLANISTLEAKQYSLQLGDFVRTIDCITNASGVIVGVSMVSASNVVLKGGFMAANRQSLSMENSQYPICLHGCLLPDGIQMFGCQIIQDQ